MAPVKAKLPRVDDDEADGWLEKAGVPVGGPLSTVQVVEVGDVDALPAASRMRTSKVCDPSARPV